MKELKITTASAPALLIFQHTPEIAAARGTILFYHGLGACKEANRRELESLAGLGFLAVGIDNFAHGERRIPGVEPSRLPFSSGEMTFLDMVRQTAAEIPAIIDDLAARGIADPARIGACGISMGGYITYAAPLRDPRVRVITPVLGSPRWTDRDSDSPHKSPQGFSPVALLAQNGGMDTCVPPRFAREFNDVLKPYYRECPHRLSYVEFPHSEHFMREEDWSRLWQNVLDWHERFLGSEA